jgi:RHS repeat-associated protein
VLLAGTGLANSRGIVIGHDDLRLTVSVQLNTPPKATPPGSHRQLARQPTLAADSDFAPPYDGQTLEIRSVIVKLDTPTRDGDQEIFLLTNLPRPQIDALEVSEQYRLRWRIETAMQRLEADSETGLHCNRARYYDPKVGRWLSQDPLEFAAGDGNLCRYVGNAPMRSGDPSGLDPDLSKLSKEGRRRASTLEPDVTPL